MKKCAIPSEQILTMIQQLLKFPFPQICRHSVCADLLSLLEQNGYPVSGDLAGAVIQANDEVSLKLLRGK